MTWKTIRMELARTPEFPLGSSDYGYELHAPLSAEGHLDVKAWRADRKNCTVRRFWRGEPDRKGELLHTRHGWAFSYEPGEEDDEALFKLDRHLFRQGEYIPVREPGGEAHTFKIVSVR